MESACIYFPPIPSCAYRVTAKHLERKALNRRAKVLVYQSQAIQNLGRDGFNQLQAYTSVCERHYKPIDIKYSVHYPRNHNNGLDNNARENKDTAGT
jgi:hypothetical protein